MFYPTVQVLTIAILVHFTCAEFTECTTSDTDCGRFLFGRRCCNSEENCCRSEGAFTSNLCCKKSETCCSAIGRCCNENQICRQSLGGEKEWSCQIKECVDTNADTWGTGEEYRICAMQGSPQCRNKEGKYKKTHIFFAGKTKKYICKWWNETNHPEYGEYDKGNNCMLTKDSRAPWCYTVPLKTPSGESYAQGKGWDYCFRKCDQADDTKDYFL